MQLLVAGLVAAASWAAAADPSDAVGEHVRARLLSEQTALVPGTSSWLGLHLNHDPHWHTYWINPGDSGLATKLKWQLPVGFSAGEIVWPVPKRITLGELYNFGYEGDVLLPVQIEVPADVPVGSSVHIEAEAKWLACREECIPGKGTFALDLPVRAISAADAGNASAFAAARNTLPQLSDTAAVARVVDGRIVVSVTGTDLTPGGIDAFVQTTKVVSNAPPRVEKRAGVLVLDFAKSDYFTAPPASLDLLLLRPGTTALQVRAAFVAAH